MLDVILEKGGVAGLVLYVVYRDLISPKLRQKKYSQPVNDRRRNTVPRINKNDRPGNAQACIKHTTKLGELGAKVKMLCDSNTREHTEIKAYVREKFEDVISRLDK